MAPASSSDDVRDVVLRDGSTLAVRSAGEGDLERVLAFYQGLSAISLYQRFLGTRRLTAAGIRPLLPVDRAAGRALVGECGGEVVAFAGYYRAAGAPSADVSFAIADSLHGRGIATHLLERLAELARSEGVREFEADVLQDNRAMLDVFRECGYAVAQQAERGVAHVTLSLEPSAVHEEQRAKRSSLAATASMRALFEPRVVAVVGASRQRGKIGSEILHNLIDAGFTGTIVPVHPSAATVQGLTAYPRMIDVPEAVDLAVVVVPAAQVLAAVDDCIAKGVRAICVISAGFGEAGGEGRRLQDRLLEKVRAAGCRLVGPNCMGLVNTDPAVRLNATFSPVYPPQGSVAMSTQSGALGLAILDYARQLNIGISTFVSVGNKVDVSGNDLIQYWAEDPRTSVILLYLESFGNPRKFGEIARRVGRVKPIVAVKAGRSAAGAKAASSHTGALATSDRVVEALFRHAGVIRTGTLEELFDVAALLAHQPIPRGRRVAILTNAGGPGILAADACAANGLDVVALSESTRTELRSFLPDAASVGNPTDMLASAPPEHYARALRTLLADERVDSVLAIYIPPLVTDSDAVASALVAAAAEAHGKPIAAIFMRAAGAPAALAPIPCYAFPESAAVALARAAAYGEWRRKPEERLPVFADVSADSARTIVDHALARGGGWLSPDETARLLASCGISQPPARCVTTADEAVVAAAEVGFPVALKAIGPALLHKTERRAVVLNLRDAAAVRAAAGELATRLGSDSNGLLVQRMVSGGAEMLIGALHDPSFGPLVVCGTGGVLVDLLADSAFRTHPLTIDDAAEMVDELRGSRLLRGYRGADPLDERAFRETLLRVSALLGICPEIQELDLNPTVVLRSGVCVLDARVRVANQAPDPSGRRIDY
jgi:acetyl coenzyme A synthetase (ADP forming)-like protein